MVYTYSTLKYRTHIPICLSSILLICFIHSLTFYLILNVSFVVITHSKHEAYGTEQTENFLPLRALR